MELVRTRGLATYITFPLVDSAGALVTAATTPDSEIDAWSDGSAPNGFTDCTNEATEIGTTGQYYLLLTASEMDSDYVIIQVKSSSCLTQTILIRTKQDGVVASGVAQSGTASTIVLASATSFADDILNGGLVVILSGTGKGQARLITDWTNTSDTANISPNWTTNPDSTSVYIVLAGVPGLSQSEIATAVADQVWDEATTDHQTAGTTGLAVHSGLVASILTTALTESYATDGAAGTLSQILFAIQAFLQEKSISGTTMTVKKLDGSTTAMTFTLNDATTPTSITRAS